MCFIVQEKLALHHCNITLVKQALQDAYLAVKVCQLALHHCKITPVKQALQDAYLPVKVCQLTLHH
jgi:hypothetical protein